MAYKDITAKLAQYREQLEQFGAGCDRAAKEVQSINDQVNCLNKNIDEDAEVLRQWRECDRT